MEAIISAVLGDLVSRVISFVAEKRREQTTSEEDLQRLRQLLLRISAVVEEAEGRCVTNRGMIHQASTMREQMFRGYYLLDAFRCRGKKTGDEEVSLCSFVQSKFNPAKRFRRLSSDTQIGSMEFGRDVSKELKHVVLVLESMVADIKEFVIFLMSYPRMYRQPYGAYLFFDKCMFGRQMEREQAISFLLQADPPGTGSLGVLPVVGPRFIGKSTLVEYVCNDERVRSHFSSILLYSGNGLTDETVMTFRDHCVIKHQNIASGNGRSLVVIELIGDVDEGVWKRLLHSAERCMTSGSKIIVTSRSEKMVRFGTTEAIKLSCLSQEAYWKHGPGGAPKVNFHSYGGSPRDARIFHLRIYCRCLTERKSQRPVLVQGHAAQGEVPRITLGDVLLRTWSTVPLGKFEILGWRSPIPPYYNYVYASQRQDKYPRHWRGSADADGTLQLLAPGISKHDAGNSFLVDDSMANDGLGSSG
ncbi:hypothetical protein CFC21_008409 [Triticum aestivum]|uniref:Disease resistance N-terminal domain-containing protein n=2 Tax=Triticum aestivum TaxID=4565 RepID=A0A9R1ISF6_WHEAT|nr:hypothetical protein CFC21_008409 [Triticum aestivum]